MERRPAREWIVVAARLNCSIRAPAESPVSALAVSLRLAVVRAGAFPAAQAVTPLHRALAAESNANRFPTTAFCVTLPDDWAESRPGRGGPVWYRLRFDADDVDESKLLGLYIPRACLNFEVWLNGTLVHGAGRMQEPITRNCHHPQLVALPASLLRQDRNLSTSRWQGMPWPRSPRASGRRDCRHWKSGRTVSRRAPHCV